MGLVHAVVTIPSVSGMAKDAVKHGFTFGNTTQTDVQLPANLDSPLAAFFNTTPGSPVSGSDYVARYLGSSRDRGSNKTLIQYYSLDASSGGIAPHLPMGAPIGTAAFTLGAEIAGGIDLPLEVASTLSMNASLTGLAEDVPGGAPGPAGDTHPRASRRGRLYIGPLVAGALVGSTNGPVVSPSHRQLLTTAGKALWTTLNGLATPIHWYVWSRKLGQVFPIVNFWSDDTTDVIRRRGVLTVAKTSVAVP